MKAFVYERYGPPEVLQPREIAKPTPKDNEVLIKIVATTVTSGDWRVRSLNIPRGFKLISRVMFGWNKPRQPILGMELSGKVEAVGTKVSRFKPGDSVFAFSDTAMGCYAEYVCLPETGAVCLKPENLSYEEAAALSFGGTTAMDFFDRGNLTQGDAVLINGASGGVGTAAIQLAKHAGARITAVCSEANADLVRELGADRVIDYHRENILSSGNKYDLIMDTAGTIPLAHASRLLTKNGRYLMVLGGLPDMLSIPWLSLTTGKKVVAGPAKVRPEQLQQLAELAKAGNYKPVIDRVYPFDQMVEAHRHVDAGHKKGNVVVSLRDTAL